MIHLCGSTCICIRTSRCSVIGSNSSKYKVECWIYYTHHFIPLIQSRLEVYIGCLGTRSRPGFCRGRFVLGRQCDVPIRLINLNNGVIFDIFSTFNEYYEYSLVVCVQLKKYSFYIYIYFCEKEWVFNLYWMNMVFSQNYIFSHLIHCAFQKVWIIPMHTSITEAYLGHINTPLFFNLHTFSVRFTLSIVKFTR